MAFCLNKLVIITALKSIVVVYSLVQNSPQYAFKHFKRALEVELQNFVNSSLNLVYPADLHLQPL